MAFYSELEHEVLPVTSGYRVTLTYNLYHKPIHPGASSIHAPFHLKLKLALADLVNDPSILPNGGYLGFGLVHEYVYTRKNLLEPAMAQLKGSDRAFADVCDALGLRYSLRLLYPNLGDARVNLLTTVTLNVSNSLDMDSEEVSWKNYLEEALKGLTIDQAEAIAIIGQPPQMYHSWLYNEKLLEPFCKTPKAELLETTPMKSSVDAMSPVMTYGNQVELEYFYGTACMVIALEPPASRHLSGP